MKLKLIAASLFFTPILTILLWSMPAEATRGRTVDCSAGDSIQQRMDAAVLSADQGEDVIINLASDCREDITVVGNDVTIRTRPGVSRARLKGTITIDGAKRFTITNLRITGSSYGIVATNGASGDITDIRAEDNERSGILVEKGASVTLTDSKLDGNGRKLPVRDAGLEVRENATVVSRGNLIEANSFAAVLVTSDGVFRNGRRDLDDDDDQPDREEDTYIQRGCSKGSSPGCGVSGATVVYIDTKALGELRNASVTGQFVVAGLSNVEMFTSRMFGNISGFDRSGLNIDLSVFGSGRLLCSSDAFSYGAQPYRCGNFFASRPP